MRIGLGCDAGPPSAAVLRLLDAAGLPVAGVAGAEPPALLAAGEHRWLLAPGGDVVAGCVGGVLDAAVVGKDVLLELEPDVYELLDLRADADRLVFATPEGGRVARPRPRVATRYPRLTRRHFARDGRQVVTLSLSAPGLAPALAMADGVVELESRLSGFPGLEVREAVVATSARLVAGPAAHTLSAAALAGLSANLRPLVEAS